MEGRSRSGGREDASEGENVVSAYLVGILFPTIFPLSRKPHYLVFFKKNFKIEFIWVTLVNQIM